MRAGGTFPRVPGGFRMPLFRPVRHRPGTHAMSSPSSNITSVRKETRQFAPPPEFAARAHVQSLADYERLWQKAKDDPEGFWGEQAESLHWFRRWTKVLDWKEPHAKWF